MQDIEIVEKMFSEEGSPPVIYTQNDNDNDSGIDSDFLEEIESVVSIGSDY